MAIVFFYWPETECSSWIPAVTTFSNCCASYWFISSGMFEMNVLPLIVMSVASMTAMTTAMYVMSETSRVLSDLLFWRWRSWARSSVTGGWYVQLHNARPSKTRGRRSWTTDFSVTSFCYVYRTYTVSIDRHVHRNWICQLLITDKDKRNSFFDDGSIDLHIDSSTKLF
jgi:hypothetical protein